MRNHGNRVPYTKIEGKPTVDRIGNPIDHITTGHRNSLLPK